jgi:beta-lactamase superfamily II metal-dependent hydrolase
LDRRRRRRPTLIVAPSGQSLLIDTGWAVGDRDAKRIYAATQRAGLKQIDHFVLSHYHADHAGGLAALSKMIPIGRFTAAATTSGKPAGLDGFVNASKDGGQ